MIASCRKAMEQRAYKAATLVAALFVLSAASAMAEPFEPVTRFDGPQINFDFPAMRVGIAEYDEGPTGTTVFYFPDGVKGAVDVRGGSPGTLNATVLQNAREARMIDAVVFSGGSWYGLSAATGAANAIKDLKAAEDQPNAIAGVVGAIIYDVGARRMLRVTPDDALGRAALESAEAGWFPLGSQGAGRFAMQGYYVARLNKEFPTEYWPHSGQGGAFREIGPIKVGVFTVVNALGAIVDRKGRIVRCRRNTLHNDCPLVGDVLARVGTGLGDDDLVTEPSENTTLTLVVTNRKMPFTELQRLAKQVHGSMSRGIQPFATAADGDVLYAMTTDEVEDTALSSTDFAVIASELAWDAILASVPELPPEPRVVATNPKPESLEILVGDYEFNDHARVGIRLKEDKLVALYGGIRQAYFLEPEHPLIPTVDGAFVLDTPARDVLHFDLQDGEVTGLTLNPGPWEQSATRLE
jgi:L-aminopeptidase/D-esterase-like protein